TVLALVKAVAVPETEIHSPTAWLRSVALHKLQDHFRAAARVQHLIDQATTDSTAGNEPDPAGREEANERRAAVRRVMDGLPEQHRLALEWKYIDHLSVREIAERMATTEKAVESVLFRARREFRDGLGGLHPDDEPLSANGNGQPVRIDPSPVSGCAGSDSRADVEAQQPAGFENLKQRQSR
ncbi:MAG TPA: sigma-70 family RNA polymerase sigma factor, partial [Planctomycetaceae bacterium]|nr:sigma-70 family RNA polymerase sigma factor [Planctomycetaceae bacterium]